MFILGIVSYLRSTFLFRVSWVGFVVVGGSYVKIDKVFVFIRRERLLLINCMINFGLSGGDL